MRWSGQELGVEQSGTLPGLAKLNNLVRSVRTPEFAGVTFHEVLAKSALNKVPGQSAMPFGWTINPYRGCQHACVYCLSPETGITMADGREQPLWSVEVGDKVIGTRIVDGMRRYVESKVVAKWATHKPAYRVSLADGTSIIASADHRFLTNRGWKHVTGAMSGPGQRPYLTTSNSLMGFGRGLRPDGPPPAVLDRDYLRGYLTGMIRGDGMMLRREYPRTGGGSYMAHRFRLALADEEALARSRMYLEQFGVSTYAFQFSPRTETRRAMHAIRTSRRADYDVILGVIEWEPNPSTPWHAGFLAGIFDVEGSCSRGVLRISNSDAMMLQTTLNALGHFGIDGVLEPTRPNGVASVRVRGGLPARQMFFSVAQPAITRKLGMSGMAVKTHADLRVTAVEPLGETIDMFDITTTTGDFIANGVVSHNCFARPTHTYLDLDAGDDFDRQIIVKVNVGEVLRTELAKPSWRHEPVALGTNTDPYQRAEGRYALMPGIIDALVESGTPFSILTKGTLLRRDLPQLADAATRVPVDLAMSIAVYDHDLQQSVEPGTPSTKARLATVAAVRDAGLDCAVFMMPILPYLTDTKAHLDEALRQAKAAGATSVLYTALHLKPGVKPWFMQWLEQEHPELVSKYRSLYYGRNAYAPKDYRRWLGERMRPLMRAHGLERGREDPVTGGVRSAALRPAPTPTLPDAFALPADPAALF
ncbi:MAG TPA: intein-containing Rv2578c family radical SAM protein [Agromyces sp.]|nr:intein-containing Rv2578c family radical SAM protein [Agromyces sp.]